ncbi:HD-GYP domain-containing protein [Streptomyces sp. NPDC092296]|uniref:HD-GYP domain-containing protein n=1 Tax=Streptomyces sp. NPDC092296 TaxID=3366012 RepID=UPI0037F9557A
MPPAARACLTAAAPAAAAGLLPLLPQIQQRSAAARWLGAPVPWATLGVLALLYAGCHLLTRRHPGRPAPDDLTPARSDAATTGAFLPVLLAGALLLPPAAAALAAVPGALLGPAPPPRAARRLWNSAQLGLAAFATAAVFRLLHGPQLLLGARFPSALAPAATAAMTFCLVNGVLLSTITAVATRPPRPLATGRAVLLRSAVPCLAHGLVALMTAALWQGPYGAFAAVVALLPLSVSCWVYGEYHREQAAHRATVRALVQAVEIKDEYTRGHSERVGRASVLIAREIGMAEDRMHCLRFAGILHDVGKLGVPTPLLRKNGPLTPAERRAVELHPEYGHEMVRGIRFLGEARAGILHHHERMDGRGYPYGLTGAEIPEFARVIAVADAFDSMTSTRSYRRGRPVPEAVTELRRCAGTQFDPVMVDALVSAVATHGWRPAEPPPEPAEAPAAGGGGAIPDIPLGVPEPSRPAPGPPARPAPTAASPAPTGSAQAQPAPTGSTPSRSAQAHRR